MSKGKQIAKAQASVAPTDHSLKEAIALIQSLKFAKFDESVDLAVSLGIDPKRSDQMVRSAIVLPHGLGKKVRILVFAKGEKEKEALEKGADYVGGDDLVARIQEGWLDFDQVIATPDMMAAVGKVGKILGPRGLMPNPKTGTVTFEVGKAVQEAKQGKIEFKSEKAGILHFSVGRASFDANMLLENVMTAMGAILKAKPQTSKGKYVKSISISTTMGPGVKIDVNQLLKEVV
jgi:large subunit ribosomal protein L1|uniref:Large ribosomal subunit protein uL1 n=1 Tax=Leptospirillum ferrodiazotrophum TaxID=412449 RepID=C6HVV4_9BACT|nr:MAG: ribosomal protein L1 [Leptospirillum ferrodiazotrophum]